MIGEMSGSVLIVDDDHLFRELARTVLSRAGLAVIGEAGTAAAALTEATKLPYPGLRETTGEISGERVFRS